MARALLLAALAVPAALCAPAAPAEAPGAPYAPILLDRESYSWGDRVGIRVVAPSWNADAHAVDSIGGEEPRHVRVATRGHELRPYRLVETGHDTGVFAGEVVLTGFPHDADGDGRPDTRPRTSGGGPADGLLQAGRDDAVTVSFSFSGGAVLSKSAPVSWVAGTAGFAQGGVINGAAAGIVVEDADMNLDPDVPDAFEVGVFSDSDPAGLRAAVVETGPATGVFAGEVLLERGGPPGGNRLRAAAGDRVTVVYDDRTPPPGAGGALRVESTALAGPAVPPLERLRQYGLSAGAAGGGEPRAGLPVQLSASVRNEQGRDQAFVLAFRVTGPAGAAAALPWASGTLGPGQEAAVSVQWVPGRPGAHEVESLAWDSLGSPEALAPPQSLAVPVAGPAPPRG